VCASHSQRIKLFVLPDTLALLRGGQNVGNGVDLRKFLASLFVSPFLVLQDLFQLQCTARMHMWTAHVNGILHATPPHAQTVF
jgi:hypothetical protein